MKNRKSLLCAIALLFLAPQGVAIAEETVNLEDDIETPDTLLKTTDTKKKNAQYGDSNIVISGDGDKHNEIVTPDPLESSLDSEHKNKHAKDIKLKPKQATEDDKAIEHPDPLLKTTKSEKKPEKNNTHSSDKSHELEMPDPLLDNMN